MIGADDFLPALIFSVFEARPKGFISEFRFVKEYRNSFRVTGMIEYYLTSFESVIDFISSLEQKNLNIEASRYNVSGRSAQG